MTFHEMDNCKVFFVAHSVGLVSEIFAEGTDDPVTAETDHPRHPRSPTANATGRGRGFCYARVHPKAESFAKRHYVTADEAADEVLYHAVRYARQRVRSGSGVPTDLKIDLLWTNLLQWIKLRDVQHATTALMLGAGWWRDGSSGSKDLAELGALIRVLDRLVSGHVPDDESALADYDSGFDVRLH